MESLLHTTPLRRGWTTGACATAAAKAAFTALHTGVFPDPIDIWLPGDKRPSFALAQTILDTDSAFAAIVKDAGDDPDVTHDALVGALVRRGAPGTGVTFRAGPGVGTVTKPGLMLAVGEPAINPMPREMMRRAIAEAAEAYNVPADADIEISVADGDLLATKTMNARLGIMGGLSILGTTGIVIPYSCSAWIHSIHRGIDVARATGIRHIAGSTGNTSEAAIQKLHGLSDSALIDMGDFAGGMLKYARKHPVEKITIAGGFAKMSKLAQGRLDLHSRAGSVDMRFIAQIAANEGLPADIVAQLEQANTAKHLLELTGNYAQRLTDAIAACAWQTAARALEGSSTSLEIVLFDREGKLLARTPFHPTH